MGAEEPIQTFGRDVDEKLRAMDERGHGKVLLASAEPAVPRSLA